MQVFGTTPHNLNDTAMHVGGIAIGQIADGLITDAKLASGAPAHATTGTYVGNGATNRAIPHGLAVKPKLVIIMGANASNSFAVHSEDTLQGGAFGTTVTYLIVTPKDATNFYVSPNLTNANTYNYTWMAIV